MELLGHLGLALVVYAPVAALAVDRGRPRRAGVGLAGVLVLAMAPDVDLFLAGVAHRGITHTAAAVVVAAVVVALVAVAVRPGGSDAASRGRLGAVVGGAAVGSHLLGDVLTPMGIRPFLPLSETTYTLSLVYAADQRANLALLVLGMFVFTLAIDRAGDASEMTRRAPPVETDGGYERDLGDADTTD